MEYSQLNEDELGFMEQLLLKRSLPDQLVSTQKRMETAALRLVRLGQLLLVEHECVSCFCWYP